MKKVTNGAMGCLIMSGACALSALKVDILVLPDAVLVDDV